MIDFVSSKTAYIKKIKLKNIYSYGFNFKFCPRNTNKISSLQASPLLPVFIAFQDDLLHG